MKLFTRPRPLMIGQLRIGDMVATDDKGAFITSEAAYMDLNLLGEGEAVRWVVVHNSDINTTPDELAQGRDWVIVHTLGIEALEADGFVVTRDVIEIDPWSYVRGVSA